MRRDRELCLRQGDFSGGKVLANTSKRLINQDLPLSGSVVPSLLLFLRTSPDDTGSPRLKSSQERQIMLKKSLAAATLTLALAWASPASALSITFDPTGTPGPGGDRQIDVLDPTVGNSIALNATGASAAGTQVTALFQANLTKALLNGADVPLGGAQFTVVAGFHEVITSNVAGTIR